MQSTSSDNFFRKKYVSSTAFLVAILLFLLPFVEVTCNDAPFAENTGIGLAFGTDYKVSGQMRSFQKTFDEKSDRPSKVSKESGKQYVFALFALLLGVAGLTLSFLGSRMANLSFFAGLLAAVCLLALMVHLKMDISDKTKDGIDSDEFGNRVKITATFTAWYWLSVVSFLAAAYFSYLHKEKHYAHEQPPGHAPQLDIENPGDQSEFPRSASESEIG
jgi:hypothetical protein